mmetsp:Transcript_28966/g.68032  ORF Transcript_28966/g.68032 Transcript_28966/m.68032 type:complete len:295 (-) Transcript_28966:54-938(-)
MRVVPVPTGRREPMICFVPTPQSTGGSPLVGPGIARRFLPAPYPIQLGIAAALRTYDWPLWEWSWSVAIMAKIQIAKAVTTSQHQQQPQRQHHPVKPMMTETTTKTTIRCWSSSPAVRPTCGPFPGPLSFRGGTSTRGNPSPTPWRGSSRRRRAWPSIRTRGPWSACGNRSIRPPSRTSTETRRRKTKRERSALTTWCAIFPGGCSASRRCRHFRLLQRACASVRRKWTEPCGCPRVTFRPSWVGGEHRPTTMSTPFRVRTIARSLCTWGQQQRPWTPTPTRRRRRRRRFPCRT